MFLLEKITDTDLVQSDPDQIFLRNQNKFYVAIDNLTSIGININVGGSG